jgi:hypothetical protein
MSRRRVDPETGQPQLTYRERVFINEYIKNGGNGKEAAIAAGYGAARADQSAYQVLHRIQVQRQIQDRISESDVCADEVIGTLASFMRGNIALLLDDDGNLDLALVKERRLGHLLKTVTRTTRKIKTDSGQPLQVAQHYRIQLHSPVQAASILARLMGLNRRTSGFQPGDIAVDEPSSLPNDLPHHLPDDLRDDLPHSLDNDLPEGLRANNNCEPSEPASRHGIEEILDPTFWMERLIKLEMERRGCSRSEVIETLIQLRPDCADFIQPDPDPHDDSPDTPSDNPPGESRGIAKFQPTQPAPHNSTGIPPTRVGVWLSSSLLSQPTTPLESPDLESDNAAHDTKIVEDPKLTVRSGAVGTQTPTAKHLKRINSTVENLKKINTTQCLDLDSTRRPDTSPEPFDPK